MHKYNNGLWEHCVNYVYKAIEKQYITKKFFFHNTNDVILELESLYNPLL